MALSFISSAYYSNIATRSYADNGDNGDCPLTMATLHLLPYLYGIQNTFKNKITPSLTKSKSSGKNSFVTRKFSRSLVIRVCMRYLRVCYLSMYEACIFLWKWLSTSSTAWNKNELLVDNNAWSRILQDIIRHLIMKRCVQESIARNETATLNSCFMYLNILSLHILEKYIIC